MRRPLIITTGIVIILLVLGLWIYLLVYGTPKSPRDVFANLGVVSSPGIAAEPNSTSQAGATATSSDTQLALSGSHLQQLTTRQVAGFVFKTDSKNTTIRYIEKGTGYAYEINADTGVEQQISLTTVPGTSQAIFSPSGLMVAFISDKNDAQVTSIAALKATSSSSTVLTLHPLPLGAQNVAFKNDSTVYYTLDDGLHTIAYSYDVRSLTSTKLFIIAASDMRALWGGDLNRMFLETRPASGLEGYAYEVLRNSPNPVTDQEPGLTALANNAYIIETFASSSQYVSVALNNWIPTTQAIPMIPEKCTFESVTDRHIWCAAPLENINSQFLEDWYKGTITSSDYLWYTDLSTHHSVVAADLQTLSGRILDVTGLTISSDHAFLLFENKTDGTLWLFKNKQ